ncbi:MAG: carboxypeptidase regulatory-like domain-containing protein [Terracidiphilus sp.]
MPFPRGSILCILSLLLLIAFPHRVSAESGEVAAVHGTVTDPTGAVIPNATVHLTSSLSGLSRTVTSNGDGQFNFLNVPFSTYQISASAQGFASTSRSFEFHSVLGVSLDLVLTVAAASQTVTVQSSGELINDSPTFHTDLDRSLFIKVPLESQSSTLSSLVTETTPGVAADSNGLFHGLGDHASNSFYVDGQPITDQQSKVFSNQLPSNAIQSIQVISGAPPAEYGDKTSLVIVTTTRSGEGVTRPTGDVNSSYGSFGSATGEFDLSYGGKNWGNFLETDGLNTGRFLDAPEFSVFHDKGNELNFFDRVDANLTPVDSLHTDLNYSRSWFQTPNAYDNLNVQNVETTGAYSGISAAPEFQSVGDTDQRSLIETYNIAPTYTRILSDQAVLNVGVYIRRDGYHYYPSGNPLADRGPEDLQTSSVAQYRTLTNTGIHSDLSYVRGVNTFKMGATYEQTFLREHDSLGVVDPSYLYSSPCLDVYGNPEAGYSSPSECPPGQQNPYYLSVLAPYDLTRGGGLYSYFGHTDVKELALYIEDEIKKGNWDFNLGLREDLYNGLTDANQTEPRLGIAYRVAPTQTVLRVSYARTLETPFNENLVLSSEGCSNPVLAPLLNCTPGVSSTMQPGYRNEFHAGLEQPFGRWLVFSGEYIWKYTHNAFDFSVLGNTPITFPIAWHNSKIPGYALRVDVPQTHGFSAYLVASSVAARFFPPQVAGAGATVGQSGLPFRIDHDEKFNQTTHVQYTNTHGKLLGGLWVGFNWRYDSGLVAGSTPCYNVNDPNSSCPNSSYAPNSPVGASGLPTTPATLDGQPAVVLVDNNIPFTINPITDGIAYIPLTADEEFEAGLACNGDQATPTHLIGTRVANTPYYECVASQLTSSLLRIPAPGTGDNDHNPPRVAPRSLFDVTVGKDNIFHASRYKLDVDLTAINVADKYALYNFLSTFSGTHYVTPRALTAKITLNF